MTEFDYIVVGSGPAAVASAYELAKRSRVLIIEKGAIPSKDLYAPNKSVNSLYSSIFPILSDKSLFAFGQGGTFGGGSVVNGALFWPLPSHIRDSWLRMFGKGFIDEIDENYDFWFKKLGACYSDDEQPKNRNRDSVIMRDAAKSLSWKVVTVPRLIFNCVLNNNCGFGCEGKLSMDKFFSRELKEKVDVLTNTEVFRVLSEGKSIKAVVTSAGVISARKGVVLAAGATNSFYILKNSGLVSKSYVQFHLNFKILVLHDDVINADRGTMFTHQIQEFMHEGILFMPTNVTRKAIKTCIMNLPDDGQRYILENVEKVAIYVVQIQPGAVGRLKQFFGFKFAKYNLLESDYDLIYKGLELALTWMKRAGFKEIVLPRKVKPRIESIELCNVAKTQYDFLSVHSTSANRMSVDESRGNTDINGLVWGTKNLWVTDSSSLPSNLGESPQGVIMSNASRICESIK
jgi:choline dehydrogenase-like flavoprotein